MKCFDVQRLFWELSSASGMLDKILLLLLHSWPFQALSFYDGKCHVNTQNT